MCFAGVYVFSLQSSVHVLVCSGLWALLLRGHLSSCPGFVLGVSWFWGGFQLPAAG